MSNLGVPSSSFTGQSPANENQQMEASNNKNTQNNESADPIDRLISKFPSKKGDAGDREDGKVPVTQLGLSLDNLMAQFNNLVAQFTIQSGHVPSTIDIKEQSELSVKQFKNACIELNCEFERVAVEWHLAHPEELDQQQITDYKLAIEQQECILRKLKDSLNSLTKQNK